MRLNLCSGTAGGTVFSVLVQLHSGDVLRTALLAAIGAVVSFGVSWLLQQVTRRRRR